MSTAKEILLVPKDFDEVKEIRLSIHDLGAFCFTFGLSQNVMKPNLIELFKKYYPGKQTSCANAIIRVHN